MIIERKQYKGLWGFKVKGKKEYLIVDGNTMRKQGKEIVYDCFGAVLHEVPAASPSTCSASYMREDCRNVSWKEIPEEWQRVFREAIVS